MKDNDKGRVAVTSRFSVALLKKRRIYLATLHSSLFTRHLSPFLGRCYNGDPSKSEEGLDGFCRRKSQATDS
jgi:hypothetical protein